MIVAIGLMSGASRDGIDAALIRTNGVDRVEPLAFHFAPYTADIKGQLAEACRIAINGAAPLAHPIIGENQAILTELHVVPAHTLVMKASMTAKDNGIIGLHDHTIAHHADLGWTWQIVDPQAIADDLDIIVVAEMRRFDVKFGDHGAPLIPVYHRAIFADPRRPVAVLNLGAVANLTCLGRDGALFAFDCGMAKALIDEWMTQKSNHEIDEGGSCAAMGEVDEVRLTRMLEHLFFSAPIPKSLDQCAFDLIDVEGLSLAAGAATLTAFSAKAVALGIEQLPTRPMQLIVCGGGRKNATMLKMIEHYSGIVPICADAPGWDGDAIEAQGFAYLAHRCLQRLPITYPRTTGRREPMSGDIVFRPQRNTTRWVTA